ncbi:hypothetical protein [Rhizobium laguerreae]|uniref:hypothetical protein n=1 Tax=Rhizobium laguerreae TaxID=1076926 RepID=UPI001C92267A|nr:hypothetical protein [Rhizobium laguerreae]MBY3483329.1 hypothetical protein [Rhizobium laguerreae]
MPLEEFDTGSWRRHHDPEGAFLSQVKVHSADDAASFVTICAGGPAGRKLKASGSHWALSEATFSDGEFIETNWPPARNTPRNTGFAAIDMMDLINQDLFDFMVANPPQRPTQLASDPCITDGLQSCFFVHIKSGTRIYEAYSLLDRSPDVVTELATQLNNKLIGSVFEAAYDGPWAFQTLGGAGGQTVFGALTTGTHGGDYRQQPVSDSVLAIHLVTDGGSHFWIEPATSQIEHQLTDDQKLNEHFADLVPGIPFEIIRDDDVFHSVVVGAGRFGVVSSLVLRVVPQYCLHEHRRLDRWSNVKTMLNTDNIHHVFDRVHFAGTPAEQTDDRNAFTDRFGSPRNFNNRFLQIAVNLSPSAHNDRLCGVTQRWFYPPSGAEAADPDGNLRGRNERGTEQVAGQVGAYVPPDDDSGAGGNSTFLSRACASGNFISGLLRQAADEIDEIVRDGAVPAAGIAAAALGIGAGAAVIAIAGICVVLVAAAALLRELADEADAAGDVSLAKVVDDGVKAITNEPLIPDEIAIMLLRVIFELVFKSEQGNRDFVALSYAVMDAHDYLDRSCFGNAVSIEVFFDATRPDLYTAYVDEIVGFEAFQQEQKKKFSVGYVSLRYVRGSAALLAPSRFDETVVIEVAAIRDAAGSEDFVMNAARVARKRIFNATFHWGQFNPLDREEVRRHYGAKLDRWQDALRRLTDGGRRDAFSSQFTRDKGLEP